MSLKLSTKLTPKLSLKLSSKLSAKMSTKLSLNCPQNCLQNSKIEPKTIHKIIQEIVPKIVHRIFPKYESLWCRFLFSEMRLQFFHNAIYSFWKKLYKKVQFWTILLPFKKYVTEKKLYVNKGCNLLNTNLLTVLFSIPLRYLAARNFMLSGTTLLRGMTNSCFKELGTFKPSFQRQHWYFEAKN